MMCIVCDMRIYLVVEPILEDIKETMYYEGLSLAHDKLHVVLDNLGDELIGQLPEVSGYKLLQLRAGLCRDIPADSDLWEIAEKVWGRKIEVAKLRSEIDERRAKIRLPENVEAQATDG